MSKKLLQINPVVRINTSTGRIMQEIGELAISCGWDSYISYSYGRDGVKSCKSTCVPVGNKFSVAWHGLMTRLFDRHGLSSDSATIEFIKDIENINPDIIHIHNIHGYFLNYKILFDFLSKNNAKVIWTVHDCWLYTGHCYHYSFAKCDKWKTICGKCPQHKLFPKSWWMDRSSKNFRDKKNAFTSIPKDRMTIVPVSEWIRKEMSESFLKDYNFRVIHNGIDTEVFKIYDSQYVRDRYNLGNRHIILGVASIWCDEKGWNDFIQLSSFLTKDEIIVLVGITEKQKTLLPQNIIGISRTDNIGQLAELYSVAEVFINPTWQDNYPTVNLEAIACGTPVITYRTGGSVEVITEITGMIVEQGDIKGLLKAFREIKVRGKSYYQQNCRNYALQNFRKEDCYADYIRLYDELLAKK